MDPMMPDLWEKESMKEREGEQRTLDTKHTLAGVKKLNDAFNYTFGTFPRSTAGWLYANKSLQIITQCILGTKILMKFKKLS